MFVTASRIAAGLCLLGAASAVLGQSTGTEDDDLKRIPRATEATSTLNAAAPSSIAGQRVRIEDALSDWDARTLTVPTPTTQPSWQNRLSLDADLKLRIADDVALAISDRLNVFAGSNLSSLSRANAENDLREAYISDALTPKTYVQLGRVNLKEGVAYGYNPTDFFKGRTGVQLASIDPSSARENRLGVVMVKAQQLFDVGSVTAAFAPKLTDAMAIPTSAPSSFDFGWGRTNAENRAVLAATWSGSAFNPQVLAFHDDVGTHWGASVSRVLNTSTVGYLEWSGVREPSLLARAIQFGEKTGVFPEGLAEREHISASEQFSNDVAAGVSWTSSANLTLNLEYHFHGSGLSGAEFKREFAHGIHGLAGASQFWYERQYAADQQEPFTRREFFVRADWQDVIPSTLNLGAIAFIAQNDGSALTQLYAQYFISRNWTISTYLGATVGSKTSTFGSLPWRMSGVFQIARYF